MCYSFTSSVPSTPLIIATSSSLALPDLSSQYLCLSIGLPKNFFQVFPVTFLTKFLASPTTSRHETKPWTHHHDFSFMIRLFKSSYPNSTIPPPHPHFIMIYFCPHRSSKTVLIEILVAKSSEPFSVCSLQALFFSWPIKPCWLLCLLDPKPIGFVEFLEHDLNLMK